MFVVMFVHVVPSINAAHEGVVTGHWALDMNGDMHTQDSALGAGANSHQQLISGSEARTEAGPGSLGPLFVARVCDCPLPAPGTGPVLGVTRVLALAWSGHWLPPPAHQCQFRPELPNVNTRDPATPGHKSKSWAGQYFV